MDTMLLEFHNWRLLAPDDKNELIALFQFSLAPKSVREVGRGPTQDQYFWTETKLQRFLATQPGWASLSKDDKVKVLFHFAQEGIRSVRRKVRQAELFWTATSPYAKGPVVLPSAIEFPNAPAVEVEPEDTASAVRFHARAGAGL
jgi:predicted Fe-S protein YdhL (DUF1289 family)